ncbi:MAG: helix-turn-helix domain-containing protein [Ruminococcaceae bacterium]|nr:helix-turn-helix domain-containing protein [Oscillospiraceae bacterium]
MIVHKKGDSMNISKIISKNRANQKMSQEQFAEALGVSRQTVQKWETGMTLPDTENLMKISKMFGVSLDALVFGSGVREQEEKRLIDDFQPDYTSIPAWELYSSSEQMRVEYKQCLDEGLDVAEYEDLFKATVKLPRGKHREAIANEIFRMIREAKLIEDYPFEEPSDYAEIRRLRDGYVPEGIIPDTKTLEKKIRGAWVGRFCGCFLGAPVECCRRNELIPFLKQTGNYPMHRYLRSSDLSKEILRNYKFTFYKGSQCSDLVDHMPSNDDTNYTVMAQMIVKRYGRDFTPFDVSRLWLSAQCKDAYCTAERVAFRNLILGYNPPESAMYKNPYREWIGAQIRGDYYGYINPGDFETAADMAWRDASISHVKNGIYGAMMVAAMISAAAVTDNLQAIVRAGLGQIPKTSRLYKKCTRIYRMHEEGRTEKEVFSDIYRRYDDTDSHDWTHTISNAEIVVAALLYGMGDFARSICMAVEVGFDTDCNGATVGSILGMRGGIDCIGEEWRRPIGDRLDTSIFGLPSITIDELVKTTLEQINPR